ncbi:class I SAM-dependent methyltransferase [Streptomyces sp. M10(2022)]
MSVAEAWNGPVGQHWAGNSGRYDAMLAQFDAPLFDAAAIETDDRVLDIGCGSGHTTRLAALRAAGRVMGVDISVPLIERARTLTDSAQHPNASYELGMHRSIRSNRAATTW